MTRLAARLAVTRLAARLAWFGDESSGPSVDVVAGVIALALHGAFMLASPRAEAVAPRARLSEVELFEIETPPPRVEQETPAPAPVPESHRVARSPTPERTERPASAAPETQNAIATASDVPLDLSASVVAGNEGIAFGSTGGGGGQGARPSVGAPAPAAAPGERVARGASDLSSDIRPPSGLDRLLEAYFPASARAQGTTGFARVRLRFDVNGRVVSAAVTNETPAGSGFGAACRRMLLEGPTWTPALDPTGAPIARVGRDFRCQFDLR